MNGKTRLPFNIHLPDSAFAVMTAPGVCIGYVYPQPQPPVNLAGHAKNVARKLPRWTAMLLDGTVATRNAKNRRGAIRSLKNAIKRRAGV